MTEPNDTERVLQEIYDLKKLIYDTYIVEKEIKVEEDEIANEEEDIKRKQELLIEGLTILRYANIQAWKKMVWDHCESRQRVHTKREIRFNCALLHGPCRFETCPKNVKKK